jgi:hypothetical protein
MEFSDLDEKEKMRQWTGKKGFEKDLERLCLSGREIQIVCVLVCGVWVWVCVSVSVYVRVSVRVCMCVSLSVCVMKEIMQHFWKIETLDNLKKTKMILNLFRDLSFLLHNHGILKINLNRRVACYFYLLKVVTMVKFTIQHDLISL